MLVSGVRRKVSLTTDHVGAIAKLLGFAEHGIQILMAMHKFTSLGDPAPNTPKWFAAVQVIQLAEDPYWLHKATKEVARHWRNKSKLRQPSLAGRAD